jgi:spore coat protein CotH/Leucine-rich repeat (LRR) protein
MKKILNLFILITMIALISACSYVNTIIEFTDSQFETAIRDILDKPDEDLYSSDVRDITVLELPGKNIESLDGIQYFSSLEKLDLEDNFIKDVTPLSDLTSLKWLSLRNNQIIDLEAVSFDAIVDLPLTYLSLRHNVVEDENSEVRLTDISLLSNFSQLVSLELRDNQISNIRPIESLVRLTELDISQNPLEDTNLNSLRFLTNLQELNIRETGATNLDVLRALTNLEYLNIHSNRSLDSIGFLSNLVQLERLIAANVNIGDEIDVIGQLSNLLVLNIENTNVSDLSVLAQLMANGALQDKDGILEIAEVNISSNPVSTASYELIEPYWDNIGIRQPVRLPIGDDLTPVINEYMASNGDSIEDFQGNSEDWIELYNPLDRAFDLSGYYLSDDETNLSKWAFPQGTMIEAKGYLLIFASGKNLETYFGELHTNFSLNADGEPILLVDGDNETIVDRVEEREVPRNYAYGRKEDGQNDWVYFDLINATPNGSNNNATPYNEDGSIVPEDIQTNTESFERFFNDQEAKSIIIQISEEEWNAYDQAMLDYSDMFNGELRTDYYAKADFIYEDSQGSIFIENIGFRTRGNTSRVRIQNDDGSLNMSNFKISFHESFNDEALMINNSRTVFEVEELDMKWNRNEDSTYLTEKFSLDLMREFGVYAAHTSLANVYIEIDGERHYYGVYTVFEPIDKLFIEKRFEQDEAQGDLYKSLWQRFGPASLREDYPFSAIGIKDASLNYRPTYDLKTNKDSFDRTLLEDFIENINQLNGQAFDDYITQHFDVDRFLRYLAVGVLLGNPDDYRAMANNYYLYNDPVNNQWTIIPYDYDHGMGQGWTGEPVFDNWTIDADIYDWGNLNAHLQGRDYANPLSDKILKIERYQLTYEAYLAELIDPNNDYFNVDVFISVYQNHQSLYNETLQDAMMSLDFGLRNIEWYMNEKIASIEEQLQYYQDHPEERPN